MKKEKSSARERLAAAVDMSKEIILNTVKLVFIGNSELTVENFKAISDYSESSIIINISTGRLKIEGKSLEIRSISPEMLFITGKISRTEFLEV